ncbi:hypothetical protein DENSPDRAFT_930231 [Dentipellis sp. KUC8613]|nr:hypothetical protein DENSPDRAFT_930231 [Dentipellis sp. KUC8613]
MYKLRHHVELQQWAHAELMIGVPSTYPTSVSPRLMHRYCTRHALIPPEALPPAPNPRSLSSCISFSAPHSSASAVVCRRVRLRCPTPPAGRRLPGSTHKARAVHIFPASCPRCCMLQREAPHLTRSARVSRSTSCNPHRLAIASPAK